MPFQIDLINAAMLGTNFLYLLIMLVSSLLKKNKTMMSAPFILFCAMITGLQLVSCLEWLQKALNYSLTVYKGLFVADFSLSFFAGAMFYWYVSTYIYALKNPQKDQRPGSDRRLIRIILLSGLLTCGLFAVSLQTGWFYTFDADGYEVYTDAYPILFFLGSLWPVLNLIRILQNRKVFSPLSLILFLSYILVPLLLFVVDATYRLALGTISTAPVFLLIYTRIDNAQGERLLEQKAQLSQKEAEMTETKMELMMSQIQPHFLYNALSSIAYLCTEDPTEAEIATNEFAGYLKGNLQFIGSKAPIPFEIELAHVEQYLKIEKRRFFDRLNVVYDIREKDFRIPALTLQTLVENAVRYSVNYKYEPTTVTVGSEKTDTEYLVTIRDDGPGFDTSAKPTDDRRHIGLSGARYRLKEMLDGWLEIDSVIGKGTTVTIHIPT